ncbi:hypothetical protein MWSIV6_0952 [Methanothermobacter wolfeii]|nr:hypothetical protein MWSIV6_0952 [Methanothermobacter wolfeii]
MIVRGEPPYPDEERILVDESRIPCLVEILRYDE